MMLINSGVFIILLQLFVLSQAQSNRNRIIASSQPKDAQIAVFKCSTSQYQSLYFELTTNSWKFIPKRIVNDIQPVKNCIESDNDLFSLCQKLYPNLEVQNIERVQQAVEFSVYTSSKKPIFEKQSIQPYKCLHGKYESKSLFVPTDCQFKSLYANSEECKPQDDWQQQAAKTCQDMNMLLNVSEFLQWCDRTKLAHFSGIEFVCCSNIDLNAIIEDEDIDDDGDEDTDADEDEEDFVAINGDRNEIENKKVKISNIDAKYESQQIEINKKWKAELKTSSEPDKTLIDNDFKRQLTELENAKQEEIFAAEVAFNEILQAKLNKQKYEKTNEVEEEMRKSGGSDLLNLFTNLFTLYERDRLLQVTIYKRLKSNFPDQYKTQVKTIVENLKLIEAIVVKNQQSAAQFKLDCSGVFSRYKQSQEDAARIIKESSDSSSEPVVSVIADAPPSSNDDNYDSNEVVYDSNESDQVTTAAAATTTKPKVVVEYSDEEVNSEINISSSESQEEDDDDDDSSSNEIKVIDDQNKFIPSNVDPNLKLNNPNKVLDEVNDDDDDDEDDDEYEIPKYDKIKSKGITKVALIVTICAFSSLIVIIVLGVLIKRKNSNRFGGGKNKGFVQVGQCSPEEAHVNQMQINGYENPAYKYFEQNQA